MRPSVDGDNLKAVIGFRQHHHELRSLDDLSDCAHVKKTHIQSAERRWNATQCRVVLVAQRLGLGLRRGLIQTRKSGRGRTTSAASSTSSASRRRRTTAPDIRSTPPDPGQVRMTIGHARYAAVAAVPACAARRAGAVADQTSVVAIAAVAIKCFIKVSAWLPLPPGARTFHTPVHPRW